ncbi:unnamed protein product [Diabrotica balteata]|uniref:O-acyltransferase WSD1 C-terminal domain-containing protein n=1 Tax=Diabrotica balteata TaxID=107213 RepID=A0A9P0DZ26_DIABA|nr:unnamed protein product [Diabrotica balteata]
MSFRCPELYISLYNVTNSTNETPALSELNNLVAECSLFVIINSFYLIICCIPLKAAKQRLNLFAHYYVLIYILLPFIITIACLLFLYKTAVSVFLQIKYGSQYLGLLESQDAVWTTEDLSKSVIDVIVTIKCKKAPDLFIEEFKNRLQTKWLSRPKEYPKLTSTIENCLGYSFYLKGNFSVNSCVDTEYFAEDFIDIDYIQSYLTARSKKGLPKNNKIPWEIVFIPSKTTVYYNELYMVLRLSHIIGDGASLINFFVNTILDQPVTTSLSIQPSLQKSPINTLREKIETIIKAPAIQLYQHLIKEKDVNILHRQKLSGERLFVGVSEKKANLINCVKRIKRKIPSTTFMEILLTAFSASLNDYFKKVNSLLLSSVCSIIPSGVLNHLLNMDTFTMTLSNVPGISKVTVLKGNEISDVVFLHPNEEQVVWDLQF